MSNANVVTWDQASLPPGYWANTIQTGAGYRIPVSEKSNRIFDYLLEIQPRYIQTHPSTLKRLETYILRLTP